VSALPPSDAPGSENVGVADYLRPVVRRLWLIVPLVVAVTVATYVYYDRQPRQYSASTQIFIGSGSSDPTAFVPPTNERTLQNQARLLRTRTVARSVARDIGFAGDPSALLAMVSASPQDGSDFLVVGATANEPRSAATIANAFAEAFIQARSEERRREVQRALTAAEKQLRDLRASGAEDALLGSVRDRIDRLQVAQSTPSGEAEQIDRALPPSSAIAPNPKRNAMFALVLSLMVGILAAYWLERWDRRMEDVEDIESIMPGPVLALIPEDRRPAPIVDGRPVLPDRLREAFRTLLTNLNVASHDQPFKTLLVTSAIPREGKSTIVRNLALAYGEAGFRTVVVEADLRRPTLAGLFAVEPGPGLSDALLDGAGPLPVQEIQLERRTERQPVAVSSGGHDEMGHHGYDPSQNGAGSTGFGIMTAGTEVDNPPAILSPQRLSALLDELSERYDVVIIDTPPILAVSDAMPLMSSVDATLLVCRIGETTSDAAQRTAETIGRIQHVRMLGVVANGIPERDLVQTSYGYY
jgi:Mrp family chromosome partitioning ATPase/capsular polysaccharide biosynthesis protein